MCEVMDPRRWMPLASLLCVSGMLVGQATMMVDAMMNITVGEHPRDTMGVVGGIVTLKCVVRNKGPHSVYWFRHGAHKYLSRDNRIFNLPGLSSFVDRLSIQGNTNSGEFNLRITNISIDDNDQYSCMFFLGQDFAGMSNPASLTVYIPPDSGGPSCEIRSTENIGPGVKVTMMCTSMGSLPNTRLDWKHRVEILPGTIVQGARPKAMYEVRLTDMDNGATFTCQESSPALYKPRTCQVKPFFMPTNVTVGLDPPILTTGADVIIGCDVQAVPSKVNYTWSINNKNLTTANDQRIKILNNGRGLRISNVKAEDNGTLVTCSASNVLTLEASDYTILSIYSEQLQTSEAVTGRSPKNVAIIAGVLGTLVLLVLAAIVGIRKRRQMSSEKPRMTRAQQARFSDCEYLDEHRFGGVEICNTPRDAIAEHLKDNPDKDIGPNDDGETAARVLLVAGPPKSREPPRLPAIKPVLPPISPIMTSPKKRSPGPLSPGLPINEIPPSLPSIGPRKVGHGGPVKRFPLPPDRLPGMPGKYHAKGPLPRPPRAPTSPITQERHARDFLRS